MSRTIKHILFVLVMALLSLPLFQHATKLFDAGELNGDFVLNRRPEFSVKSWMKGTFQAGFDRYIEDHIGFRNFFVRLNNQIDFTFFDNINAEGLIVGKENQLYEYDYIRAYTGEDFIGEKTISRIMNKLKFVQGHLKNEFGIDLILIFEPSKARILPESIPDRYLENKTPRSNYEIFKRKAEELNITHIDLNQYLDRVNDTIRYPVYPPYGIHWSEHTMSFITDTLIRYIETLRGIDMPDFRVETRIVSDSISDSDYDAGHTSNLLFRLPHPEMPYPFFTFNDDTAKTRPMVLAVADSYYWNIFNTRVPKNLFANEAFWYFNAKVFPDFYFDEKWTKDLNIKSEVEKQDVILLGITERFLYKFGWEFTDQLYDIYTPDYSGDIVEKFEIKIRNYSTWFDQIQDSASKKNLNLERLIRLTAHNQAMIEDFETYITWYGPEYYEQLISNDPGWRDAVLEKARNKNVDFQYQLTKEALWSFEHNKPDIFRKYQLIGAYKDSIRSNAAWMKAIEQKAKKFYLSTETMINIDAEYMANQILKKETPFGRRVQYFEELIRNSPEWMESIRKKAGERNITTEEMLQKDAVYMAEQEQLKKKQKQ